mgnify:CR=1 FL=1
MSVFVRRPGLFTTVQDLGRWGYQRFGMPVAGAMDVFSYRLGNCLVGNIPPLASLEITLTGPELDFQDRCVCAITGADFEVHVDGVEIALNRRFVVRSGQHMWFGRLRSGARAYLAISGGFDVPLVLGSRSTHVASGIGGVDGRALRAGDLLKLGRVPDSVLPPVMSATPRVKLPKGGSKVRVLTGPHSQIFDSVSTKGFVQSRYRITGESDRMGYRLAGDPIPPSDSANVISTAVPVGSVQVPSDGLPIVLMADHQTTGGYPRIATVISADLPVLGQLKVSDWIEFEVCERSEAIEGLVAQERALMAVGD